MRSIAAIGKFVAWLEAADEDDEEVDAEDGTLDEEVGFYDAAGELCLPVVRATARAKHDAFGRYHMPALVAYSDGGQTMLPNLAAVAAVLGRTGRPTRMLVDFLVAMVADSMPDSEPEPEPEPEGGAAAWARELPLETSRSAAAWWLRGAHRASSLQPLVYDFIERVVLCRACRSPETDLGRHGLVPHVLSCAVCGDERAVRVHW